MNGCSESISDKPVFRPVAEAVDQCELLDECIAPLATVDNSRCGSSPDCGRFLVPDRKSAIAGRRPSDIAARIRLSTSTAAHPVPET